MKTAEIINSFMKGGSWDDLIYFEDCYFSIRNCKTLASGGSYVGSRIIQGRYTIEKLYRIRFTEGSKHTAVYGQVDIDHFRRENIGFEIIKPTVNTSTR